jgi:SAM-dependent methyltransferase
VSEFDRWQGRYGVQEYIFGKAPNRFLASCKPLLAGLSSALVIADGEGRNGVWLADQGLDVHSIDFSTRAKEKAEQLAKERNVRLVFETADVHAWDYPSARFDVAVEIFAQFSAPPDRLKKWTGMQRAVKPGGLIIIQGYTPKQLAFGTGGPKQIENLYTRDLLETAFRGFKDMQVIEEELELREGTAHAGMSAVIGFTARKPRQEG